MNRLFLAALLIPASCGKAPAGPGPRAASKPKVTASLPTVQEVEFAVDAVGSVEASEEISIPARVSGPVDRVSFKEGDVVTGATTLAEIDVERFRLAEARAKAQMDRAQSQAALAEPPRRTRWVGRKDRGPGRCLA